MIITPEDHLMQQVSLVEIHREQILTSERQELSICKPELSPHRVLGFISHLSLIRLLRSHLQISIPTLGQILHQHKT